MARIKPFCALRPQEGYAQRIAALPYDVYHREEAGEVVEKEPLSFLRIDRPETNFPPGQDMYASCVYEKAGQLLQEWQDKGYLRQDERQGYYLYELTMNGRTQTGIVAVAAVEDYLDQVILKHENTRKEKEEDRIRHIKACNAQTGPIFLAYRDKQELTRLTMQGKKQQPEVDFTAQDGVRHRVFTIDDPSMVKAIEEAFLQVERIYIADGHHRCAAAVKTALERRKTGEGNGEAEYFLSVLFPESELKIFDYNRVVMDYHGQTREELMERIQKEFIVTAAEDKVSPSLKGHFGMFLEGQWYELTFRREEELGDDAVKGLDVSVLQDYLLEPVLGIKDPRTDKRIEFVGGIRGLQELEKRVNETKGVAFSLKAVTMEELFAVADMGLLMPPKSTWFEPKLRSGLFIHRL